MNLELECLVTPKALKYLCCHSSIYGLCVREEKHTRFFLNDDDIILEASTFTGSFKCTSKFQNLHNVTFKIQLKKRGSEYY
jgi:hypothetical protein